MWNFQGLSGSLKVRIPKPGAYIEPGQLKDGDISVYDFKDEVDDSGVSPSKSPLARVKSPPHTLSTSTLPSSFKLKVSNLKGFVFLHLRTVISVLDTADQET